MVTLVGDVKTTAGEGPPRVWDTRTGRLLSTLGDEPRVYAGAFAPDGRHFATGGEKGVIRIWDVKTGHRVQQLPPQGGRVVALAYDRSGTSLAAVIRGNRAFVWRLDAPGTLLRLSQPDNVVDIAFHPEGPSSSPPATPARPASGIARPADFS